MTYLFIGVDQSGNDGLIITFNRQFTPNWLQRLLGYRAKDEYVRYIGYGQYWWDLTHGERVPEAIRQQCVLISRRFEYERTNNVRAD